MITYLPYPYHNLRTLTIKGAEYDFAVDAGSFMSVVNERGEWGGSYMNKPSDKQASQRTGRLGEVALAKLIHMPVDTEYRLRGDEYDFKIHGKTIDIKTSFRPMNPYRTMYRTDTGHVYTYPCDYYIFAHKSCDNRETKEAWITFDGYVLGEDIRNGKYKVTETLSECLAWNYVIPLTELRPFSEFYHKVYKGQL